MVVFKVIVAGGRDFENESFIYSHLDRLLANKTDIEIVSGECKTGVDKHAKAYAAKRGHKYKGFEADWNKYGKSAGPIRNRKMGDYGEAAICFWDGKSKGTGDMIKVATDKKLQLKVIRYGT